MEVISKIILGIIQGITEMIPVSSSGHLILLNELFNLELDFAYLGFLHFASAFSIFFAFWGEIKWIFLSKERYLLFKLFFISLLPAGIVGLFLHKYTETIVHNVVMIIPSLILVGILMILVDKFIPKDGKIKCLKDINENQAMFIGLAQILALIPGTSRSGITISAGVFNGLSRKTAIAFSFLMGLPLILSVFILEIFKNPHNFENNLTQENLLGALSAFIFGYFTILVFKKLANTKFLTFFGIYRIILGIVMFFLLAI